MYEYNLKIYLIIHVFESYINNQTVASLIIIHSANVRL